ncbi:amidohydrolase family protein [Streptomyces sp. NPDC006872]|uniref:amidohydrolase family protein n=1 Tax=Streptomyces sp. NPDC006872 TaxID=3155720 RepID=UPI0034090169
MYRGATVIDTHGHMSTPPEFRAYAYNILALRTASGFGALSIPDARLEQAMESHLRALDERDIDVQLLSPRPVAMMHWERPYLVEAWTRTTNDVIAQQCRIARGRFVGVAQLPQNTEHDSAYLLSELTRCVDELGFVAALVNPDPGGDRRTPGMNDPYWFPLYEFAEDRQITLIVHPSSSRDPRLDPIPHSYQYNSLTEETLAMLLFRHSDVFDRFPSLRVVVCHCGGALRRMLEHGPSSGQRMGGSAQMPVTETGHGAARDLSRNLFVDTCAYDPVFLRAAIRQYGVERMVFGTEVPGSGSAVLNVGTNRPSDDLVAVLRSYDFLSDNDRVRILHDNPLTVFPLLAASAPFATDQATA